MSHLPLDARAILHYLNELGYRNISATQLKEFLKDLRKLIKYEERMGVSTHQNDYYESLFRRTTASYRAKFDKENASAGRTGRKSFDQEKPTTSKQAAADRQKVLHERNNSEIFSSQDVLDGSHQSVDQQEFRCSRSTNKKNDVLKNTEIKSIKALIEQTLAQVLKEKYSQQPKVKDKSNAVKENSLIKSIVEEVLKEKLSDLRHFTTENLNLSEQRPLKSIIEDIVVQVLQEKLANLWRESAKTKDWEEHVNFLNQELQQKLNVSKKENELLPREPLSRYNSKKPLDSQSLVEELLGAEGSEKRKGLSKENSNIPKTTRKKQKWQDPTTHDGLVERPNAANNQKSLRQHSPTLSSRSGRSRCSSSVMIRRSVSHGRNSKPNSDPVALYQYYKNQWEIFRKQIPGESSHHRLRWHVRQRLLDPE